MNSMVTTFRVRELFPLGKGGMGTTYLGCAKAAGGFERLIAIKRLHDHLQEDSEACARLLAEAELAGCVHHANVVAVQHVDRDARGAFLVLDYVEGGSLRELMRIERPGKLPESIALRLFLDCLSGLEAIHEATDHRGRPLQILHRDISPENILVGLDGMARLTDFGIARSHSHPALTAPAQLVGKMAFMAPEYVDRGNLGPPLDIYSLGVTLWMLLVGRNPWAGLEEAQLLAALLTEGVPPLPPEAGVDASLAAVVMKACAIDADDRYQTAREFSFALQGLRSHPIAERVDVMEYVRSRFSTTTSERRIEAAHLLQVPSDLPPAPIDDEVRESESFLPIVSGAQLPSLAPSPPEAEWHDTEPLVRSIQPVITRSYRTGEREELVASSRRTSRPVDSKAAARAARAPRWTRSTLQTVWWVCSILVLSGAVFAWGRIRSLDSEGELSSGTRPAGHPGPVQATTEELTSSDATSGGEQPSPARPPSISSEAASPAPAPPGATGANGEEPPRTVREARPPIGAGQLPSGPRQPRPSEIVSRNPYR